MNVAWWLEHAADEAPDRVALVDGRGGEQLTYAQLRDRAERVAGVLREECGVGPDDVVATIMADDCWHTAIFYGVLRLGAVYSGFNRTLTTRKFAMDAERSEVGLVIVGDDHAQTGAELVATTCVQRVVTESELIAMCDAERATVPVTPRTTEDIAAVNFTGGTSGVAKGVIFPHGNLSISAQASVFYDRLTSRDVNLTCISLYHSGGIHDAVKWVIAGAKLVLSGGWDADLAVRLIREHGVTWIYFWVPTMIRDLMRHPEWEALDLDGMGAILCGEPVPADLEQALLDRGMNASNSYGMTESMPVGLLKPLPAHGDPAPPGSCGRPMPELCELVLKDLVTGERIDEPGAPGEVCVRGGIITPGYHNDAQRTADAFDADGFLHTRDVAHVDADGFYWLGGRTDDIINTGAEKISLVEVEEALRTSPLVADVACIGVAHERFGEAPAAIVVATGSEGEDELAEALEAHCLQTLERWKRPRLYARVEEIPRTQPKRTKDLAKLRALLEGVEVPDGGGARTLSALR